MTWQYLFSTPGRKEKFCPGSDEAPLFFIPCGCWLLRWENFLRRQRDLIADLAQ
jgi:hypothetical protein